MQTKVNRLIRLSGLLALALAACASRTSATDTAELRARLAAQGVVALQPAAEPARELADLGRVLFFDPELSGNRDVACATCHLPAYGTSDGLSLPIGTGGHGLGPDRRADPDHRRVARNAPDVLLRGSASWITVFWDGRVWGASGPGYMSPAGDYLPAGLDHVLAAQALFPLTAREEMRGFAGDLDVFGQPNELAAFDDEDFDGIWSAIVARLRRIEGYDPLFAAAFPDAGASIDIQHVANALAAFEIQMGNAPASPWDRFLSGEEAALSTEAVQGALLFYGQAGCSACHTGALLTDQRYHNLAVPQIGPGKGALKPLDAGRALVSGDPQDLFAFRTPALRNVALTGPWMHNGAYTSLEAVVRHHLDPARGLREYDPTQLAPDLRGEVATDAATVGGALRSATILKTLDPLVATPRSLTDAEIRRLLTFLEALTDPAATELGGIAPETVPSGLPVLSP